MSSVSRTKKGLRYGKYQNKKRANLETTIRIDRKRMSEPKKKGRNRDVGRERARH